MAMLTQILQVGKLVILVTQGLNIWQNSIALLWKIEHRFSEAIVLEEYIYNI